MALSAAESLSTPPFLTVTGLIRHYGEAPAVRGLTFSVNKGDIVGLLGPNGAGKTTTLRLLVGLLKPEAGRVNVGGVDVHTHPEAARRRLGYLPESPTAYPDLTARQYLTFLAETHGLSPVAASVDASAARMGCGSLLDLPMESLSKGQRQRVLLTGALMHGPDVLVLDEPTDGLDPQQQAHVRRLLKEMSPEKAILISTHHVAEVQALCTRLLVLHQGRLVADTTPKAFAARADGDLEKALNDLLANGGSRHAPTA